jgi:hypothetical protein
MLSDREKHMIRDTIASSEHDYFVWSSLVGEPFVVDSFICYFDGVTAAIAGVPLAHGRSANSIQSRLDRVVDDWMQRPDVGFINYFGPQQVGVAHSPNFDLIYRQKPSDHNVDLFIELGLDLTIRATRQLRQDINRAIRNGIKVEARKQEFLTAEQLRLMSELAGRADLEVSDVTYLANAATILRHDSTMAFEARVCDKVVGVGIAHHYFPGKPFFVVAAFNSGPTGVSDAIYSAVISYYRVQGADWLGLGYAATPGQYQYKHKWGGKAWNPPCWQLIWRRRDLALPFMDSLHWPWRLLGGKWCSTVNSDQRDKNGDWKNEFIDYRKLLERV